VERRECDEGQGEPKMRWERWSAREHGANAGLKPDRPLRGGFDSYALRRSRETARCEAGRLSVARRRALCGAS
jgi:hypothetical protein